MKSTVTQQLDTDTILRNPLVEPRRAQLRARAAAPGQGWDLPERRKLRCRLEDVAY